jgi:phosphatidyl-myo-inositol dimannoside synthase
MIFIWMAPQGGYTKVSLRLPASYLVAGTKGKLQEEHSVVKSLLISSIYFPPQTGGISRVMGTIASSLGPDEICCLTAVPATSPDKGDLAGVAIYRRPRAFAKGKAVQAAGFAAAVAEIMLRERPQVVQLATAYEGHMGLWLQRWLSLPFIIYAHGNEIFGALSSPWPKPRLSLIKAARVLANSRFTSALVEKTGANPAKIEIVRPGCDVNRFRPIVASSELRAELMGSSNRAPVILSVGGLMERKGHDMVIATLPKLIERFPKLVYLIVGDGPRRSNLEKLAFKTGVAASVIFAGKVSDERLPYVYSICDVFVMPSRHREEAGDVEGLGIVYLEANACGKPVVAGRSGGVPDAVIDGITGFLVDPSSPEDIASAISRLLSSPELAGRLGRQGREHVLAEFTWPQFVDRVRRICNEVATERKAEHHRPRHT